MEGKAGEILQMRCRVVPLARSESLGWLPNTGHYQSGNVRYIYDTVSLYINIYIYI